MNRYGYLTMIATGLLGGTALCGATGFPTAFQSALTNKPPEAEAALVKLAEEQDASSPYGSVRKDRTYFQAAEVAGRQDRFEQAFTLADKIQDVPLRTLARMELFARQKKHAELLETAAAANIAEWPDALIYRAAMCRAEAAIAQGEATKAEPDLILAGRYILSPHHKAKARFLLAGLYRGVLNEEVRAMEVYDELLSWAPMNWMYYNAAMEYARLAVKHGQGALGLARLDRINTDLALPNPRFPALVLECRGDVCAAMGKTNEALATFRKIVAAASVPEDIVKSVQAKIDALTKDPK